LSAETAFLERLDGKARQTPPDPDKKYFCKFCGKLMEGAKTDLVSYCSLPCAHAGRKKWYQETGAKMGNEFIGSFYMGEMDI